jgi:biofilm protein TabA
LGWELCQRSIPMILDRLENADRYAGLHPDFARALAFLRRTDLAQLAPGRYEIDGRRVDAVVAKAPGRSRDAARLETHRRYIDIQFVLAGTDEMGWRALGRCQTPDGPYDTEGDCQLFADRPEAWIAVAPGALAIFFPEDAHAPLVAQGELHKVVVKVAV